jgi:hypothetical protein
MTDEEAAALPPQPEPPAAIRAGGRRADMGGGRGRQSPLSMKQATRSPPALEGPFGSDIGGRSEAEKRYSPAECTHAPPNCVSFRADFEGRLSFGVAPQS